MVQPCFVRTRQYSIRVDGAAENGFGGFVNLVLSQKLPGHSFFYPPTPTTGSVLGYGRVQLTGMVRFRGHAAFPTAYVIH